MRSRFLLAIAATGAIAVSANVYGVSAGGRVRVSRVGVGAAPVAGRSWVLQLAVRPASFEGVVRVVATGPGRVTASARAARGWCRVRLLLTRAGVWKLAAEAGGSRSGLGAVRVQAPPLVFDEPTGIALRSDGSLLVVEFGRRRLVRVDTGTGRITEIATFDKPWGVAQAASGTVFASDRGTLLRIDPGGKPTAVAEVDPGVEIGPITVTPGGDVFYSTARALYRLPEGRAGTARPVAPEVGLDGPHGLAIAADGALLVSDTNDGRILRVDPADERVTTFARLGHPRGIGVDADGSVYVAAADEHRVVRFGASGEPLGPLGARFNDPYALTVAPDGTVYAIDVGLGVIRRIGPDGSSSVVSRAG